MSSEYPPPAASREDVYRFWTDASRHARDAENLRPTARDPFLQECLEAAMEALLPTEATLLDVGCGDGTSTLRFARRVKQVHGVDYIERFVERAREAAASASVRNASFSRADVLDLSTVRSERGTFTAAICIRCLINLTSWEDQATALREIARCLAPGSLLLISEGWAEALAGLNLRRERAGLPAIAVASYNLLISRPVFERAIGEWFEVVGYRSLGLYLYLSRVVQPALVLPQRPRHDHPVNEVAARLQIASPVSADFLDCDYAGIYILRRR